ncbi:DUF1266 domain-containing protein [Chitinophaga oryzae]|uniref:DUF1266 domain-containing protein n=1 Tax=Chitinophaga oryzae TaxID=2725414 RepID=A0AAE6ZEZ2_9BACT|nr:DUF1266 domain-containing protein [Chitinophaga oryzae]QJB31733.1 DUF1266 domain-containing protein [Chitinophaga oryzae]
MKPLLQNHPRDLNFPVRPQWRQYEKYRRQQPVLYAIATLLVTFALLDFFFLIMLVQKLVKDPAPLTGAQWTAIIGFIALVSLFFVVARYIGTLPLREQQRYYQVNGITWLSEEKRQALRLELVDIYKGGYWSETLEYYPLAALQGPGKYHTFTPADANLYKKDLDQSWGILTTDNYRKVAQQLLTKGYHAEPFAMTVSLRNESREVSTRLAALTGLPESYILSCVEHRPGGRPPKLIWGYECWRLIVISRDAYMAGHITAEEAWKNILQAADYVYELFDDFTDFCNNYRLGNAFWSNSFEVTNERTVAYEKYLAQCDWPMKHLPWPAAKGIQLPEAMATGFATELAIAKSLQQQPGGLN